MANVLADLVIKIRGDASDLNESLKRTFKETKDATQGFQQLGKSLFKISAILAAFAGGVLLMFKNAFDNFLATVGDPSLEEAMMEFDALLNEISITIGQIFAPVLTDIIEGITNFIKGFKDGNPELFNMIVAVVGVGAAILAIIATLGLFASALLSSLGALSVLSAGISTFIGATLLPLLPIIALVALLWATGILDMKAIAENTFAGIGKIFEGFGKLLSGDLSGLGDILLGIWKLTVGNLLIVFFGFVKKMNDFSTLLTKLIITAFYDIAKIGTKIFVDFFNFMIAIAEDAINKMIAALNVFLAAAKLPTIGAVSIGRLSAEPILENLEASKLAAIQGAEAANRSFQSSANVMQEVTVNIDTLFVDSDKHVQDLGNKVAEVLANNVSNRTGFTPYYENP